MPLATVSVGAAGAPGRPVGVRLQPEVGLPYYWRATSLLALGKRRQAVKDLRAAMRLDPEVRQRLRESGAAEQFGL